ncbi:hypothetical protein L1987_02764 [Smallanthus sonchifolius]|uniref:Uncharacterized protein n=1 Tax=Smallanthus sonchifolius TaxID=185202 RepID=A0ACB9K8V9_9ASTR|nr:hypothetical protein L1987_02764 [Smallanthus sonchifolius]
MLSLSLRYGAENTSKDNINLSHKLDLRDVLPERVTIGFLGSTGPYVEKHILRYWQFSSNLKTTSEKKDNSNEMKFGVGLTVHVTDQVDPNSDLGLVEWVWSLLGKTDLLSGVDPMLNQEFEAKEFECLMMVGLWCSHADRSLRPSIRQAIQVLKFEGALPNLPTKSEVSCSSATMTNSSIDLVR